MRRAAAWGGFAGGLGGAAMFASTNSMLARGHTGVDLPAEWARVVASMGLALGDGDARRSALFASFAGGAVLGALLGPLARRTVRIVARAVFFTGLMPCLWIFVQAFLVRRVSPALAQTLPLGPFLAGSLLFGLSMTLLRPPRERAVRTR